MNKYVLALEGGDGSGKTTVAQIIENHCLKNKVPYHYIGRNLHNAPKHIYALTNVLQEFGNCYSARTEIMIRIAREIQRATEGAKLLNGLVVYDRFVLSVLARSYVDNIFDLPVEFLLDHATAISGLNATIFIDCPFEIAWDRIQVAFLTTGENLSSKEKKGMEYNRIFLSHHKKLFETSEITKNKIILENSIGKDVLKLKTLEHVDFIITELSKSINKY